MKNESTRAAAPRKDQSGTRGGNAPAKKKYYRRPHRLTLGVRVFIALMCALLAFLLAVVVAYYCGYRYICIEREDGELVRFVGRVDATGTPYAGRLYYSSGSRQRSIPPQDALNTQTEPHIREILLIFTAMASAR